jgi:hypothetical protein
MKAVIRPWGRSLYQQVEYIASAARIVLGFSPIACRKFEIPYRHAYRFPKGIWQMPAMPDHLNVSANRDNE